MTPTLMQELTYQGSVNELLLAAKLPRTPGSGLLSPFELREMDAAMVRGVSPHRFVLWVIAFRADEPAAFHPADYMRASNG